MNFKGLLKLNIKTFTALFVRALSKFTSTSLQTRNKKFNSLEFQITSKKTYVLISEGTN